MDNQALQKLRQTLLDAESIGIVVGANPTIDEMGAALALYLSLKAANKKVSVASPTEPIVELSSLVGIDQVRSSFGTSAAGDLVVSFPYKEGEIEKVSYTLDNGFLNIVVKAGELGLNFNDQDVQFTHGSAGAPTHVIVVGAASLSDTGDILSSEEMKDVTIINIDNKQNNEGFGNIVLVSPRLSSVSEQVAQILMAMNMPLDVDSAQNMLSGISYATANFQDPKTSFMAFEMAGELMRLGAVRQPTPIPDMSAIPSPRPQARYPQMNQSEDDFGMDASADAAAPYPQPQRPQPRPGQMPRNQQMSNRGPQRPPQRSQIPDRGPQNAQGRMNQPRMNQQPQRGQQPPMGQPMTSQPQIAQRNRQDEIREELARAAQMNQQTGTPSYDEPQDEQPAPQPQPQSNGRSQNPPADWLTPKVYKGSSDVNN